MRVRRGRPWQATAAFWCYIASAVAVVAIGLLLVAVLPDAVRAKAGTATVAQGQINGLVSVVLLLVVGYAVIVGGLALLFASGRGWARVLVVITSASSVVVVAGLGVTVVILVVAADVLVFLPPVGRWLRDGIWSDGRRMLRRRAPR